MGNYSMPGYFQAMPVIRGRMYRPSPENVQQLKTVERDIRQKAAGLLASGTPDEQIHSKGQYTAMERILELVDEGSFCPLNSLYNPAGNDQEKIGVVNTGVVKGLGRISGKWAVIIASDNCRTRSRMRAWNWKR